MKRRASQAGAPSGPPSPESFATTHWTVVLEARDGCDHAADAALERLCSLYWDPLYGYIRRRGYSPADAEDLTQGFFAKLLAKDYLGDVHPEKGRFRSFLLAAMRHFLADEYDKATALKRGGGRSPIALDSAEAERRLRPELAHDSTPEKLYERRWVMSLLALVSSRLRKKYTDSGQEKLFQVIQAFLTPDSEDADYASAANSLRMSEGAVRMAVHRLRRRFAELFREEVGNTVSRPEEIEDEINHLRRVLSE